MGNYAGTATFHTNVYQFELTDPVQGGPDGIDNLPLKHLADRTQYLRLNNVGEVATFAMPTPPAGWLKANGATLLRATYPELFAAIGRRFGRRVTNPGAGSSVFTSVNRVDGTTAEAHGFTTGAEINIEGFGSVGSFTVAFGGSAVTPSQAVYVRAINTTTFSIHPTPTDATNNTNAGTCPTFNAGAYVTVELTTSFTLPDMRGQFARGWDDGRGIDTDRVLGSNQMDGIRDHNHRFPLGDLGGGGQVGNLEYDATANAGTVSLPMVSGTAANETRPRNIALLYCIKFG